MNGWSDELNVLSDQRLVRACLDGNRDAFAALVRRYQHSVHGLAVGMTHNREDAADMAQETFIRAYAKLDQYNSDYPFKSWIFRICANQTKNLFRKRSRRRRAEEKLLLEEMVRAEESTSEFSELEAALERLSPRLSAPILLKHREGMTYEEISKVLGIGVSAAKMRASRGRKELAEMMNHDG